MDGTSRIRRHTRIPLVESRGQRPEPAFSTAGFQLLGCHRQLWSSVLQRPARPEQRVAVGFSAIADVLQRLSDVGE